MHGTILAVHIFMGTLGVLSGTAALVFRKGGGPHRAVGTVFVLAMVLMAGTASVLELMKTVPGTAFGGLMTIYFIVTAWVAGRRKDGETGPFEIVAFVAAIAIAAALSIGAYPIITGAAKAPNPFYPYAIVVVSGAMVLAALADLSVVFRGGIGGAQRIARHLWRMCFGLFISVGSFAAQGGRVLPASIRREVFLAAIILVFAVMFYWLVRVLMTKWYARSEPAS